MNNFNLIILGLSLFGFSAIFVRYFCGYAYRRGLLDIPNIRSSHQDITPRGGGVVFVCLWLLSLLIGAGLDIISLEELKVFFPGALFISLLGYWDDHQNLSARRRLVLQCLIATCTVASLGGIPSLHLWEHKVLHLGSLGTLLAVLGFVWSINLYNFMDGLDGLASTAALFIFGVGGCIVACQGGMQLALLSFGLFFCVGGFLIWNWPKARIFMGDVGSCCLGFLVALFAAVSDRWYGVSVLVWMILYSAFWFDATVTLLRRLWFKQNVTLAHREHASQRLHRAGFSHQQVLFGFIGLNVILSCIAIVGSYYPRFLGWGLLLAVMILAIIYLIIERLKPMAK